MQKQPIECWTSSFEGQQFYLFHWSSKEINWLNKTNKQTLRIFWNFYCFFCSFHPKWEKNFPNFKKKPIKLNEENLKCLKQKMIFLFHQMIFPNERHLTDNFWFHLSRKTQKNMMINNNIKQTWTMAIRYCLLTTTTKTENKTLTEKKN